MSKVILVDDDETVRFLTQMQFLEAAIPFESFSSFLPLEALIKSSSEVLINSILLVDVNLPDENGDDFLLRYHDQLLTIEGIRIVVLTNSPSSVKDLNSLKSITQYSPKQELVNLVKSLQND